MTQIVEHSGPITVTFGSAEIRGWFYDALDRLCLPPSRKKPRRARRLARREHRGLLASMERLQGIA